MLKMTLDTTRKTTKLESLEDEPPSPAPALDEHTEALRQQTKEGRIRYLGSRNGMEKGPGSLVGHEKRTDPGVQEVG